MSETKSYSVRYYQGVTKQTEQCTLKVSDIVTGIAEQVAAGEMAPQHSDGEVYELRDLLSFNNGAVIRGVFAVLRDDAPHIREAAGSEKPIPLAEGDAILEKNHFLFFKANQLLVWQVNGRASHVSRLERYLTSCTDNQCAVLFDDVLSLNALDQLTNGVVTRLEFRAAKPRNAELIDPNDWESRAFEMMNDSDASIVSVTVSTRSKQRGLSDRLKGAIHRLLNADTTRKVEIKLRNVEDPIDLMTECLKGKIVVDMDGLYPNTKQMFSEMQVLKDSHQPALDAYFGRGNAVLD
jgi:hypothetical protein